MVSHKRKMELYNTVTSPVLKVRLARMLDLDVSDALFDAFYSSKWIMQLRENQHPDGSFGRFHSRNSKVRQKFPTTEHAINAMKMLGLTRGTPMTDHLCAYMEGILDGDILWPDGFERNRWYDAAQPLFVASKLSVFGSENEIYTDIRDLWILVLQEAFSSGRYNATSADMAARKLQSVGIDGSYIGLNSMYVIELLGNSAEHIDPALQYAYLNWLKTGGIVICYSGVNLSRALKHEISELYPVLYELSKFDCFRDLFASELDVLRGRYCKDDLWNFGGKFTAQRLSDSWRSDRDLIYDHTILAWMANMD